MLFHAVLLLSLVSARVTQVYSAVDDRLTSLKTDTFNKTREEKMEDLFAKKEVITKKDGFNVSWLYILYEISLSP